MRKKICYILVFLLVLCSSIFFSACNEDANEYNINVNVWYANYGTVYGNGTYKEKTEVEIKAVPNNNYSFIAWMKNNIIVSYEADYKFEVNKESAGTYVAIFTCPDLELVTLKNVELVQTYTTQTTITNIELNVSIGQDYDTLTKILTTSTDSNTSFDITDYVTALNYREKIVAQVDLIYTLTTVVDEKETELKTTKTTLIEINLDGETLSSKDFTLKILDSLTENEENSATIKFNFTKLEVKEEEPQE